MPYNHFKNQYSHKPKQRKTIEIMTARELEKVLDRVFSEFIRLAATDDNGYAVCFTCGSIHHWKDIDCGHFISRSVKATRFDETNCQCQCKKCNRFRSGEHHIFRQRLIEKYGKEEVEKLELKARLGGSDNADSLRMKIVFYRNEVKQLKIEKGL